MGATKPHSRLEFVEGCKECRRELRAVEVKKNRIRMVRAARVVREILETVDNRCMAADGPVTPTVQEITPQEFRRLYRAVVRISESSS